MKRVDPKNKSALAGKLLRLLKLGGSLQDSIGLHKRNACVVVSENSHYDQKGIETALLDAERKKAEAMEWQRRKIIC
ncbi:MAG: hypothetical protein ACE5L6_06400 [Candidatus Bathyarchaeia archaeon]